MFGTDTRLTRVLQLMVDHRIRSMPVIDGDQRLAGIISREDILQGVGGLRRRLKSAGQSRPWSIRKRAQPALARSSSSGAIK